MWPETLVYIHVILLAYAPEQIFLPHCTYICMGMCECKYINTYSRNKYVCTHPCILIFIHTHVYMDTYMKYNVCTYIHVCLHIYTHTHICIHTLMHVCWYIYLYVYIHIAYICCRNEYTLFSSKVLMFWWENPSLLDYDDVIVLHH